MHGGVKRCLPGHETTLEAETVTNVTMKELDSQYQLAQGCISDKLINFNIDTCVL